MLKLIPDFDAYLCSLKVLVDRKILGAAKKLRVIATPSTGLDHIDIEYAKEKGVDIISLKDDYEVLKKITATAEMTWALLLGVARKIPWGFESVKQGIWARDRFRGYQLRGKTLGILGYGRLGKMVASYAKSFLMKVIACDLKKISAAGIEQVDFDNVLRNSDILSIHIHLTKENYGLIGRTAFSKMKEGIIIINTSRGTIIDEDALLEALESGRVGAAGLDVITGEWDSRLKQHPLIVYAGEHENLLISPHVGGVTFESQTLAYTRTAQKLADYLKSLN